MLSASAVRAVVFVATLGALLLLEWRRPRRRSDMQRVRRWPVNLGLVALDNAVLLALPFAAVASAGYAQAHQLGLLRSLPVPGGLAIALALLAMDLALYWQHRALHEVRWLWPIHRVHHSDVEFDVTTGVRFHPVEIAGSMLYKALLVLSLGAPLAAVIAYEASLSTFALWSHANLALPPRLERALRRVVITPDTHRVHHSVHRVEHDSNYASVLILWDHLFRSYTAQPRDGHAGMTIGLSRFRQAPAQRFVALLRQPLER